jgi:(E)-4-hydroxy-3-methylbut-2-enyl-diphosphate synthase
MNSRSVILSKSGIRMEIGGNAPVSVQTMWKEGIARIARDEDAVSRLLKKIDSLRALGCDILRFAVPDSESADALCLISRRTSMPLVADIHFDYRLALKCLEGNVAKIRINPGNIGSREKTALVAAACEKKGVPIRIGVNAGSFPKDIAVRVAAGEISRAEGLCETALRECAALEDAGFGQIVVSMKSSSVDETIAANEAFAAKSGIPLHIGVTEAGPLVGGVVKNTLALSRLLKKGIGNTVRISLSSTPENEVIAAKEILKECGVRKGGVRIVSCPRCGRSGFDVLGFLARHEAELLSLDKDITVAVMGCPVNGPGEAKHADIGITGAGNEAIIFKRGEIVRRCSADNAEKEFFEALNPYSHLGAA